MSSREGKAKVGDAGDPDTHHGQEAKTTSRDQSAPKRSYRDFVLDHGKRRTLMG